MKKLIVAVMLLGLLLTLSLSVVSAGEDWGDPVLCVAGKWLVVNAANESAVRITVPGDTPYGDEGRCQTPPPAPLFVTDVVREVGRGHTIMVSIDGKQASRPTVTVSYGNQVVAKPNNGKARLNWTFDLR